MAKLELFGNKLVIKDGSKSIPTGQTTDPANPGISAVRIAYAVAAGRGLTLTPPTPEGWINVHTGKAKPVTPKTEKTEAKPPPERKAREEERKPKPPEKKPVTREEVEEIRKRIQEKAAEQVEKATRPLSETKPKPVRITDPRVWKRNPAEWISDRMAEARAGDRKGRAAATSLAENAELKTFLSPEGQRGIERTPEQKAATTLVFNEFYRMSKFYNFLIDKTKDEKSMKANPEYTLLQIFLSQVKDQKLTDKPDANVLDNIVMQAKDYLPTISKENAMLNVIQAADMLVRDYLFYVGAKGGGNPQLRDEMSQLPNMARRMEKLRFIGNEDYAPKVSLRKMQLGEAMDSDTVVSAALYIRRWYLENPKSGRGTTQDRIAEWKAPELPQTETARAAPKAAEPLPAPEPEEVAEGEQVDFGLVGVIGDSITAGAKTGNKSYADSLSGMVANSGVNKYGVSGEKTAQMKDRFERQIIKHKPPYETVIIQGGVNDIASGVPIEKTQANLSEMFKAAKDNNMRVIVFTVAPWGGSENWDESNQRKTDALNRWLRAKDGKDIMVVDLSGLRDGTSPNMSKPYDSGDHLHPNKAGQAEMTRLLVLKMTGAEPEKAEPKTPLEKFADANWDNLPFKVSESTRAGKPEEVVAVMRDLPEGYSDLPAALKELGRTDITDAFDLMFNNYLHGDDDFLEFVSSRRNYSHLARESIMLRPSSDPKDRRFIAEAVQDFIKHTAERTDDPAYAKLKDDIKILSRAVLGLKGDDLSKDGIADMRTIAAVAVYAWRMTHMQEPAGAWVQKIPDVTIPKDLQPKTGPQIEPKETKQRRTLEL